MIRRPRDYTPHLRAEYQRRFPDRPNPQFKEFNDEVLTAVSFIMRQIDPTGKNPIIEPCAYAEGAEPGVTVKPSRKRGRARE